MFEILYLQYFMSANMCINPNVLLMDTSSTVYPLDHIRYRRGVSTLYSVCTPERQNTGTYAIGLMIDMIFATHLLGGLWLYVQVCAMHTSE